MNEAKYVEPVGRTAGRSRPESSQIGTKRSQEEFDGRFQTSYEAETLAEEFESVWKDKELVDKKTLKRNFVLLRRMAKLRRACVIIQSSLKKAHFQKKTRPSKQRAEFQKS